MKSKNRAKRRTSCQAKSKVKTDKEQSESSSDEDNRASKSVDSKGVKTSQKSADHGRTFVGTDTKTIIKDGSLLIGNEYEAWH